MKFVSRILFVLLLWGVSGAAGAAGPSIQEFLLPDNISAPSSIAVDAEGRVWFAEKVGKSLAVYDPGKKEFSAFPIPSSWGNVGPSRIALGPSGNIWITVRRWAEAVDRTDFLGEFTPADASFRRHDLSAKADNGDMRIDRNRVIPEDLLVDAKGTVWFLVPGENRLYRYDPAAGALKGYDIPTANCYPRGIAVDGKGVIWFAEANANKIASFDPETAAFGEYVVPTPFANIGELAIDGEGRVWFVELRTNRLGVFYPGTGRFDEAMLPAARSLPNALAVDGGGKVWFLEFLENKVGMFDPKTALFKEFIIPTASSLPGNVVIDSRRSRLWFSETSTEAKRLGMLAIGTESLAADGAGAAMKAGQTRGAFDEDSYLGLILVFGLIGAAVAAALLVMRRKAEK